MDRERLEEEIRQVAYELYVKSGYIEGRDLDNWLEAERRVLAKYAKLGSTEELETLNQEKVKTKRKRRTAHKTESSENCRTKKGTRKVSKTKSSTRRSRKK